MTNFTACMLDIEFRQPTVESFATEHCIFLPFSNKGTSDLHHEKVSDNLTRSVRPGHRTSPSLLCKQVLLLWSAGSYY